MAVKIKLMRLGKIRQPYYRIVVADARTRRNGKAIETIGKYHPKDEPSFIQVDSERAQYWLGVGAQPTESVESILKVTGDWQKFKGLPGSEGTLRHAEPKTSKADLFAAALAEAGGELRGSEDGTATTPKKKPTRKSDAPKADASKSDAPKAKDTKDAKGDEAKAEELAAEAPTAAADAAPAADEPADSEKAADAEKAGDGQA